MRPSRRLFLIPFLFLALVTGIAAQTSKNQSTEVSEIQRLLNEYVKATKEYVALLEKQKPGRLRNVSRAEDQVQKMRQLYAEGLVPSDDVEASQRALDESKAKVREIDEATVKAKKELQELPTVAELQPQIKKAKRTSRRGPSCSNWTLTASRRETKHSVTVSWKVVCAR